MEDEEFETASDKLTAMISMAEGTYEAPEGVADEKDEDTDQEDDSVSADGEEIDTNEQIDGDVQDTDGTADVGSGDELEENALVDDDNGEEPEAVEGDAGTETDNTEAKTEDVDPNVAGEVVDYQKQYEELLANSEMTQNFYDRVTSEFQANGKTVKGFTDPEKIIQSQQMLHGFEDKMAVFKKHKPFLRALQEQGMVEDTSKFDLAMNIANGDKEAFKQHAHNQGWDLLDMDMDAVSYEGKARTTSNIEMALDDVMETATRGGVQERMENVLGKEWDSDSVVTLLDHPRDSAILVDHMKNGIYDAVQERISEKLRTDTYGSFSNESSYRKYMVASQELETEYQAYQAEASQKAGEQKVLDEKSRIETGRKDTEYKAEASKREQAANDARAKAVRASKPKQKAKRVVKDVDKMKLTGDAFNDYFNKEILGKN